MTSSNDIRQPLTAQPTAAELSEEVLEVTGDGARVVEVGLVILLGLLVCPPLLILAVVVAVPVLAVSALVAAVVAAVVVPTWLVRRVVAHHRAHGTTLFLHRLRLR
jgi:Flp pilus assembly protein TadB